MKSYVLAHLHIGKRNDVNEHWEIHDIYATMIFVVSVSTGLGSCREQALVTGNESPAFQSNS